MAVEVGQKVNGKVTGITNFGAFVDIGDHQTGLVHISEVSEGFVKDIHDILKVGDEVTVKVLKVDNGKIGLSIRKAKENSNQTKEHSDHEHVSNHHEHPSNHNDNHHDFHGGSSRGGSNHASNNYHGRSNRSNHGENHSHEESFDDLMSGFLKESEDRLATLKKNTEGKRGGRGGRRS